MGSGTGKARSLGRSWPCLVSLLFSLAATAACLAFLPLLAARVGDITQRLEQEAAAYRYHSPIGRISMEDFVEHLGGWKRALGGLWLLWTGEGRRVVAGPSARRAPRPAVALSLPFAFPQSQ